MLGYTDFQGRPTGVFVWNGLCTCTALPGPHPAHLSASTTSTKSLQLILPATPYRPKHMRED